jgi:hypothetical protein
LFELRRAPAPGTLTLSLPVKAAGEYHSVYRAFSVKTLSLTGADQLRRRHEEGRPRAALLMIDWLSYGVTVIAFASPSLRAELPVLFASR